ncbi:MAG: alpha/beta hydrolase [Planctomycetes bacterium]|nr:alpha/beta hydrolase [Planctomycetota bacterium]
MCRLAPTALLAAGIFVIVAASSVSPQDSVAPLPPPDVRDHPYGPHPRHRLDLWKARSSQPAPLLVNIHFGGFSAGDKSTVDRAFLERCLASGISVASVNYRFHRDAPFPAPMLDCGRAVQHLRHSARPWGLDPSRVGAYGHGVGGGIALWLAFHPELATPDSADPVARQSTRLAGAVAIDAQTSYDPRFLRAHIGGRAHEHPAGPAFFGLPLEEFATPHAHRRFEEASPYHHASADDPPVLLYYRLPDVALAADQGPPGHGIHHPRFGKVLARKLAALDVPCQLVLRPSAARDFKISDPVDGPGRNEILGFLACRLVGLVEPGPGR